MFKSVFAIYFVLCRLVKAGVEAKMICSNLGRFTLVGVLLSVGGDTWFGGAAYAWVSTDNVPGATVRQLTSAITT